MAAVHGKNSSKFSKEKIRNFLIYFGKELAALPALFSSSTKHVTAQQNKRNVTAIEDQTPKKG